MQTKITIRNEAQTCYIDIEGTIGVKEKHQFENASSRVATFETFRREVARIAEVAAKNVVVNIRSTGGDVNDALLIYDALKSLDAHITTRCYGYTASAATIIAQAADEGCREISSNAMYLIHRSTCSIEGNASSLESRVELLQKTDERLAALYAERSGREAEFYAQLMAENGGEGRWLTAEETVEAGLADRIIDTLLSGALIPESEKTLPTTKQEAVRDTAAGAIIRYIFSRLAYHIEEWIERLHEKHLAKRAERRAAKAAKAEQAEEIIEEDEYVLDAAEAPTTSEEALPQGATLATQPSAIAFDEGQRRYGPTEVKPTEDPSMNQPLTSANERAYADDAKAFGRY